MKKYRIVLFLLFFLFSCLPGSFRGAEVAHANYICKVKIQANGDASLSTTYTVYAGDSPLTRSSLECRIPVFNSDAVDTETIKVTDSLDRTLSWSWDYQKRFLEISFGPLDIPAGGRYDIYISFDQSQLAPTVDEEFRFVYTWDFSETRVTPFSISSYKLEVEGPNYSFFDVYPISYVGVAPSYLEALMKQTGPDTSWTVTIEHTMPEEEITLNIYYEHKRELYLFFLILPSTIAAVIVMALVLTIIINRSRRVFH